MEFLLCILNVKNSQGCWVGKVQFKLCLLDVLSKRLFLSFCLLWRLSTHFPTLRELRTRISSSWSFFENSKVREIHMQWLCRCTRCQRNQFAEYWRSLQFREWENIDLTPSWWYNAIDNLATVLWKAVTIISSCTFSMRHHCVVSHGVL